MLLSLVIGGLVVGITVVILHARWDAFRNHVHPWLEAHATLLGAYRSVLAIIGFPFLIIGGLYTIMQVRSFTARPDLAVVVVNQKAPAVLVVNESTRIAREPKYGTVLWNLDAPEDKLLDPLPIPTEAGEPIRPGEAWGPNEWDPDVVAKLVPRERRIPIRDFRMVQPAE